MSWDGWTLGWKVERRIEVEAGTMLSQVDTDMERPNHKLLLILTLLFSTVTVESEYLRPLPRKTLTFSRYSISKAHSSYPQQVNQPRFHFFSSSVLFISYLIILIVPGFFCFGLDYCILLGYIFKLFSIS